GVLAELARVSSGILHLQWLAWPQLDRRLRLRVPAVFTAHDLLPRRTAQKTRLWRGLLARFDRVVVHSEHGHEALTALGLADWRLGYLPQPEVDRAFGEATLALFPYRPELDQSGALLRALGAGVPAVAYDVGGIAEPVRRYGAGRVVPAGDVDALAAAARELLDDPAALEAARAGARRAREELTWDRAAAA